MGEEEKKEWDLRLKALAQRDAEEVEYQNLKQMIEAAQMKKLNFLNIQDNWTAEEQKVFLTGVK